jgi:hypothetical protein
MGDPFDAQLSTEEVLQLIGGALLSVSLGHKPIILTKQITRAMIVLTAIINGHWPEISRIAMAISGDPGADWVVMEQVSGGTFPICLGVSISTQAEADERIPQLLRCRPYVETLMVSFEPAIGVADSSPWVDEIDWLIIGCESGPSRRPPASGLIETVMDNVLMYGDGIAVFVKQWPDHSGKIIKAPHFCEHPSADGREWMECAATPEDVALQPQDHFQLLEIPPSMRVEGE